MGVISGAHDVHQAKWESLWGAHGMLEQNGASFCRAWRARVKCGSFRARMACAGKMRVISSAHGVLEQNEAHFGRAWRAGAKRGKFLLRMACAGENEGHFGRAWHARGKMGGLNRFAQCARPELGGLIASADVRGPNRGLFGFNLLSEGAKQVGRGIIFAGLFGEAVWNLFRRNSSGHLFRLFEK